MERGGPSTVKKSVGWPRAGDQVVPALRWGEALTPWQPGTKLKRFQWGSGQALPPTATTEQMVSKQAHNTNAASKTLANNTLVGGLFSFVRVRVLGAVVADA